MAKIGRKASNLCMAEIKRLVFPLNPLLAEEEGYISAIHIELQLYMT